MLLETPDKSVADILTDAVRVNGDFGRAQDEIIRRLSNRLNLTIAAMNTAKGWTNSGLAIPLVKDVVIGLTDSSNFHIDKVFVTESVDTAPFGAGASINTVTVQVFAIDQTIKAEQQVRVYWARAEAIRAVLFQFLSGCINASGQVCWQQLMPTGCEIFVDDGKNFSGTVCTFAMTLPPGMN